MGRLRRFFLRSLVIRASEFKMANGESLLSPSLAVLRSGDLSRPYGRLEEYLAVRGQEYLASQGATLPTNSVAGVQPGITQGEPNLQSEYKPGAGMVAGETIPMPGQQPARGGAGRGWFGGFGGGGGAAQQQQQQQPVQAPVQAHGAGAGAGYGATSGQVRRA